MPELPILTLLRSRMHWHQERQRVLAENVANADLPRFKPRDLVPLTQGQPAGRLALGRTDPRHISAPGAAAAGGFEARASGKVVVLEDEMLKVAANQMDYQQAATLYAKSLGLVKTALGRR